MCGVVRTNSSDSELVVAPQEATGMAPSVTVPVGGAEPSKATPTADVPCHILQQQGASSNREIPTIDLAAADESDDLQKAIELSLQETPQEPTPIPIAGLTAEEQDMSKALEVSLQDTSSSTTIDIINPQDRKRLNGVPVGLKNIGNSCWFNVVIQPLFFIPVFRDMIINYPKDIEEEDNFSKVTAKRLVPALRQLFSLLIASEKKYVDPSDAVNVCQGPEMRKNTQQDVCEFIHKLLEKLEEDFKLLLKKQGIEKESSESSISKESDFENPIMKLFYGQSRKESSIDPGGTKLETFGQYILTVMKYKDIHESILASMAGGTTEDASRTLIKPTVQDTWFKTLPSVLIFSLSRYEYSIEKKRAEKVHNKFDFPDFLFMDRYMEANKDYVKEKHLKIAKIKQELHLLYNALEKYQKFGSGEAKYPIADILKYALEFAGNVVAECGEMNPLPSQSVMDVDVTEAETDVEMIDPKENEPNDKENSLNLDASDSQDELPSATQEELVQVSPNKKMRLLAPAPRNIQPGELPVLEACLPRWQQEVQLQVDFLKKSIGDLEKELALIFEEPSLHHIPYKLHSVVVHEGQASGGHYWVYIYDNLKNVWMKFNDIQVIESNWQELLQDSIGGQNNASAYCLMYIDQTRYNVLFSNQKPSLDNLSTYLPLDLQEYVKHDNAKFMSELEEWDSKPEQRMNSVDNETDPRIVPATAPNSPDMYGLDEEENNFFLDIQTMLSQTLMKAFQNEEKILLEKNQHQWLYNIVNAEIKRMKDLATHRIDDDNYSETSLLDLGIYLMKNREKEVYIHWYAFEMVCHLTQEKNSKAMNMIRQEALLFLHQIRHEYLPSLGTIFQGWKKHYQNLVKCTWYFLCGYRKLQIEQLEMALVHMIHALRLHKQIKESLPKGNAKTLDFRVLGFCHRKCLQLVNDKLVKTFLAVDTETKALEVAQTVNNLVVPALWYVNNSKNEEDEKTGDLVRYKWCQTIGSVSSNKSQLIKQIIEVLTNDGCESFKLSIKIPNIPTVLSLYKEYKDTVTVLMANPEKKDAQTSDL